MPCLLAHSRALAVLDITSCSKLSCQGIVEIAQPPLRLIAVGALFFPDHLLKGEGCSSPFSSLSFRPIMADFDVCA